MAVTAEPAAMQLPSTSLACLAPSGLLQFDGTILVPLLTDEQVVPDLPRPSASKALVNKRNKAGATTPVFGEVPGDTAVPHCALAVPSAKRVEGLACDDGDPMTAWEMNQPAPVSYSSDSFDSFETEPCRAHTADGLDSMEDLASMF